MTKSAKTETEDPYIVLTDAFCSIPNGHAVQDGFILPALAPGNHGLRQKCCEKDAGSSFGVGRGGEDIELAGASKAWSESFTLALDDIEKGGGADSGILKHLSAQFPQHTLGGSWDSWFSSLWTRLLLQFHSFNFFFIL